MKRRYLDSFVESYGDGFRFVIDITDQAGFYEYINSFRFVFNKVIVSPDGECIQFYNSDGTKFGIDCVAAVEYLGNNVYSFICRVAGYDECRWNVRVDPV